MDRLPSDLLLKIAEMSAKARQTACCLRLVNKRTHELISELRLTLFVAQRLRRKKSALREQSHLDAVLEDCAKKCRETEDASKPVSYRREQECLIIIAGRIRMAKLISDNLENRMLYVPQSQPLSASDLIAAPKSRNCVIKCALI